MDGRMHEWGEDGWMDGRMNECYSLSVLCVNMLALAWNKQQTPQMAAETFDSFSLTQEIAIKQMIFFFLVSGEAFLMSYSV